MPGPLAGVRVLDLTTALSGPFAGGLLADQGADVIKVEGPQSDVARVTGSRRGGLTSLYHLTNRGKRCIYLDITKPRGREVFDRLAARTDVMMQNFRPGVVERMGIDYESLRSSNPNVIYVSIAGFGFDGPLSQLKVFDNLIQAASGFASVQGAGGPPGYVRQLACDKVTSLQAAQAITAALFARERGAGGQHIRLSMLDASVYFLWVDAAADAAMLEPDTERYTPGRSFEIVEHTDGYLTSAPTFDDEFRGWCEAYDSAEVAADPRFASHAQRIISNDLLAVRKEVQQRGAHYPVDEMLDRLHGNGVSAVEVTTLDSLPHLAQVETNGTFNVREVPGLGRIREVNPPARFSATPSELGRPGAFPGEHTEEVLGELGFDEAEVAWMRDNGTVR